MNNWTYRKTAFSRDELPEHHRLARTLSWPHLVALGVGAIVGTGILTLIGVGAGKAGPAVILSFAIAGVICACAALAYAEVATMIPASGSAYTYSYVVFGELIAWIIGWSLILEYSLVVSAVAVGWSGYVTGFLNSLGWAMPMAWTAGPHAGGVLNLPAILIIGLVAAMLIAGTRESATLNAVLVLVKMAALALFIFVALPHFQASNFEPFMPYGFPRSGPSGSEVGVMAAAAIIFFAFYGFDAIATAAEEAKNPGRDLSIGIVGSMIACVAIYMAVAAAAIGALAYTRFADSPEPLALILREIGSGWAAQLLGASAVIALPTVILAFFYGQSRIFFTMARDGLLPQELARVSSRGSPVRITLFTAAVVAVIAGLFPLDEIAALANAGTLAAFIAVCAAMLVLRRRDPGAERTFRAPAAMLIGPVGILGCLYLFWSLPQKTQLYFLIWNALGFVVYALWAQRQAGAGAGGKRAVSLLALVVASVIPLAWEGTAKVYDGDRVIPITVRSRVEASGRVVSESWPTAAGEAKGLRRFILEPNGTGIIERGGKSETAPAAFVTEEIAQFGFYQQLQKALETCVAPWASEGGFFVVPGAVVTSFVCGKRGPTNAANWVAGTTPPVRQDFRMIGWWADEGVYFPKRLTIKRDGKPFFEMDVIRFSSGG